MPLSIDDFYSMLEGTCDEDTHKAVKAALDDSGSTLSQELDAIGQRAKNVLNRYSAADLVENRLMAPQETSTRGKSMGSLQVAAGTAESGSEASEKLFWQWRTSELQAECTKKHDCLELHLKLIPQANEPIAESIEISLANVDGTFQMIHGIGNGKITPGKKSVFRIPMLKSEKLTVGGKIILEITKELNGVRRLLQFELPLT